MSFEYFETLCPEVGSKERYVLKHSSITTPDGKPRSFVVFEYYCPLPSCDCRRVKVKFFDLGDPNAPAVAVASILYGWERARHYAKTSDDPKFCASLARGMFAPDEDRGPDCHIFLRFFQHLLKKEPTASMFPRHYRLFKEAARRELEADPSAKLFLPERGDLVMDEPWPDGLGLIGLPTDAVKVAPPGGGEKKPEV
jgi:hypothetical protein